MRRRSAHRSKPRRVPYRRLTSEPTANPKHVTPRVTPQVLVHTDDGTLAPLLSAWADGASANGVDELSTLFLTSQLEVVSSADEVNARATHVTSRAEAPAATVGVARAAGDKCERCWHYGTDVGQSDAYAGVCARCANSLKLIDFPPVCAPVAPVEH